MAEPYRVGSVTPGEDFYHGPVGQLLRLLSNQTPLPAIDGLPPLAKPPMPNLPAVLNAAMERWMLPRNSPTQVLGGNAVPEPVSTIPESIAGAERVSLPDALATAINYSQSYGPQLPPTAQGATPASAAAPAARNIFGTDTPAPMPQPERPAEDITSLLNALGLETESDVTTPAAESAQAVQNSTGDWPDYAGMVAEQLMANPFEVPDYGAMMAQHGGLWTPQQVQQAYENARSQAAMNDQRVQQVAQIHQQQQADRRQREMLQEQITDRQARQEADITARRERQQADITAKLDAQNNKFAFDMVLLQEKGAQASELADKRIRDVQLRAANALAAKGSATSAWDDPDAVMGAAAYFVGSGQMATGFGGSDARARVNSLVMRAFPRGEDDPGMLKYRMRYDANKQALMNITKADSGLSAFEESIRGSMDLLKDATARAGDTGNMIANSWIRNFKRLMGSPEVAAFEAGRQALLYDLGRALSSAQVGGSTLPVSTANAIDMILDRGLTNAQLDKVLTLLKSSAFNTRAKAYKNEMNRIEEQIDEMDREIVAALRAAGGTGALGGGSNDDNIIDWGEDAYKNVIRISGANTPTARDFDLTNRQ